MTISLMSKTVIRSSKSQMRGKPPQLMCTILLSFLLPPILKAPPKQITVFSPITATSPFMSLLKLTVLSPMRQLHISPTASSSLTEYLKQQDFDSELAAYSKANGSFSTYTGKIDGGDPVILTSMLLQPIANIGLLATGMITTSSLLSTTNFPSWMMVG